MQKILIANRGEIACRVIKTARRMGIQTVAVYSDADREALHVRMADEAYYIGPSPSNQSYLVMDKLLEVIKQCGADGVHPGYGFLSENSTFCRRLQEMGVIFIGPNPTAIDAMGDKISSKKLAQAANVNTIPGHMGIIENADEAVRIAAEIGYPVMLKASAGGGGKGMRIAHNDAEAAEGWQSATNEGLSYFGDGRVFIEKFIENPRHIEIQVLCDGHGNGVYLNERECSIQRRNQKVIEEAPSPFVDADMRRAMGEQALALAQAVDYVSAGTIEFVVGADKGFYFLEMNTRLQVEHPVTEFITGLDLVEQMIRVARGERLSITQDQVLLKGWSMESRVYAENPYRNFLPSVGRLVRYEPPLESAHVRVDTGVFAGGEVTLFYDPMIAKLITWGQDRGEAIEHMREALDSYLIEGPGHNIDFLNAVLRHPRFVSGNISTAFIAEEYPEGFEGAPLSGMDRQLFAVAAAYIEQQAQALLMDLGVEKSWVVSVDEEVLPLIFREVEGGDEVEFGDGSRFGVSGVVRPGAKKVTLTIAGQVCTFGVVRGEEGYHLTRGGRQVGVYVRTPRQHQLAQRMPVKVAPDTSKMLITPMPGLVLKIIVEVGDCVSAGDPVCVLEAMKMENIMRVERDGVVGAIFAKPGQAVESDSIIMTFE
ncbi:biotin carboxylase / biotin carboxyl carrier protein [Magnetococcus marinus MC-1]|uniref:propionyl-CoA carboxylase n=2 Tax=Magnetococcus TaxID=162171 RepID=A0L4L8_MAGMM|nr:acetyl/propionyl/methylcrotonyl-CoA carboxylase subunit alpha [Magnetococcus marinus]ABK42911.1 biotin carboxylase / biotin carboxyl carrier protein [Magnetococcus marinus MC-1]